MPLEMALSLAGLGQVTLAIASTTFPLLLGWAKELGGLRPLMRRFFWIYAGYIFGCNLSFGLLSWLAPRLLTDRSPLAAAVTGFIFIYWGARLALQFLVVDRRDVPAGAIFRFGEVALALLFVSLTAVYGVAFVRNLRG